MLVCGHVSESLICRDRQIAARKAARLSWMLVGSKYGHVKTAGNIPRLGFRLWLQSGLQMRMCLTCLANQLLATILRV
jgi:hypothetical protein